MSPPVSSPSAGYEVRFESLVQPGRAMCFPCDAAGHVNIDELAAMARINYLFARAMIGREFAWPVVRGR